MKIGNTIFNPEAVKSMTADEFKATYKGILRGVALDVAYFLLTGVKAKIEERRESRAERRKKKIQSVHSKKD